jgi:hypothetical protein
MVDFVGLNEIIGTPEMLELGRRYDPEPDAPPVPKRRRRGRHGCRTRS